MAILKLNTSQFVSGDLKSVDITFKIISPQCSWAKQLYDSSILGTNTLTYKKPKVKKTFSFHSNLYIDSKKIRQFLKYHEEILSNWSSNVSVSPKTSSTKTTIASYIIWYNKYTLVDKRVFL